jgi:hypothetical protein
VKRYFLYTLILGALGHSLLDTGTKNVHLNNIDSQIAQLEK